MRWLLAAGLTAAPAVLALACGGPEFLLSFAAEDATANDVAEEAAFETGPGGDARDEALHDVVDDHTRDAPSVDSQGGDAADAQDAADSLDAGGLDVVDATDEMPAHCGGPFMCAPVVPSGWAGPFELYEGSDPVPQCETGFSGLAIGGNAGLSAPAASCACHCGAPQGLQCSPPTITFSSSVANCATTGCAVAILTPGLCTTVDMTTKCGLGVTGADIAVPSPPAPTQGSCAAVRTVGVAVATWSTSARACGVSTASVRADCKGNSMCIPAPTSPFLGGVCIEQAGNVTCPSLDFTNKYLYYGGIDDTRSCSSCTCGQVTGASCSGSLTQFASADGGCHTAQTIYDLPQTCAPLQQPADLILSLTASNGACSPSSVSPVGTATPTVPTTFCCTQ